MSEKEADIFALVYVLAIVAAIIAGFLSGPQRDRPVYTPQMENT